VLGVSASGPVGAGAATEPDSAAGRPPPAADRPREAVTVDRDATAARTAERWAWAVLAAVDGLGPVGFGALLARYGSGAAILREAAAPGGVGRLASTPVGDDVDGATRRAFSAAVATAIAIAAEEAAPTIERIEGLGLTVVTTADAAYPSRLAAIDLPPPVLFVLGDPLALEAEASVALVGTRRATDAGRSITARLAATLASAGCSVISGLATGIDGAAHSATVHAGGTTVAVIGSGHAALFPRIHKGLAASIVSAGGAIVSELAPDIRATRGTFPRRNRVISGLADATVVIEAPARSGALITASWALEQGRECFLVPGSIDAPASAGCLGFLREFAGSARIVAGIPQLIEDLGLASRLTSPGVAVAAAASLVEVGAAAGRIGRELVHGRATVDELVSVTGWPVASVLAALTVLERHGLAVGIHGRFRPAGALAAADPATLARSARPRG
jgi:DNA processing protein